MCTSVSHIHVHVEIYTEATEYNGRCRYMLSLLKNIAQNESQPYTVYTCMYEVRGVPLVITDTFLVTFATHTPTHTLLSTME